MEIRQLRAFVAIAESGTFTAGALRVHVTQAAISMQIRQLENEIGAKVFVRAPRHVILTEAGEQLLRRAQNSLPRGRLGFWRDTHFRTLVTSVYEHAHILGRTGAASRGKVSALA